MTLDKISVTAERTPLDLLLWRHYKREIKGLVEDALGRNPGIAELGVYLPVGTVVYVKPPAPDPTGRDAIPVVSLFN